MPLVRISFMKGKPDDFGNKVGDIVHRTMVETMNVPAPDRFQIITECEMKDLIYDPGYLDIRRPDGVILIQITLNEGRTVDMKQSFYKMAAELLNTELGVRKEDVLISLVEVRKENWSFGNGIAQYAK